MSPDLLDAVQIVTALLRDPDDYRTIHRARDWIDRVQSPAPLRTAIEEGLRAVAERVSGGRGDPSRD